MNEILNNTLFANENQTLDEHLFKVTKKSMSIFKYSGFIQKYLDINNINKINYHSLEIDLHIFVGLMHDFGKTSNFFQKRLKNKNLKVSYKEFHNFGFLFIKNILSSFLGEKYNIKEEYITTNLSYILSIVIYSHHFDLDNKLTHEKFLQDNEKGYNILSGNSIIYEDKNINGFEIKLVEYINKIYEEGILDINNIKTTYSNIFINKKYDSFLKENIKIKNINNRIKYIAKYISDFDFIKIRNNILSENKNDFFGNTILLYNINNTNGIEILFNFLNFSLFPNLLIADKSISINTKLPKFDTKKNNEILFSFKEKYENKFNLKKSNILSNIRYDFFEKLDYFSNNKQVYNKKLHIIEGITGIGKTFSLFNYSINLLKSNSNLNKIIYIAPYVSILEQNYNVIKNIFEKDSKLDDLFIKKVNYLSDKDYHINDNKENYNLSNYFSKFLIQTLNSKVILTTYVNMFDSLFSFKNKDVLKLNGFLNNSIIIIDEIQDFSKKSLFFLKYFIDEIAPQFNLKIVFSSGTIPYFLEDMKNNKNSFSYNYINDNNVDENFKKFLNRNNYSFIKNNEKFFFNILQDEDKLNINNLFMKYISNDTLKKFLFLNSTIKSSRIIGENLLKKLGLNLEDEGKEVYGNDNNLYKFYFLNNEDKTHFEKNLIINEIKTNENKNLKILLFTTQIIKAGVDIDMDIGFIDMLNLYDIIQFGGRINREFKKDKGNIFIYKLKDGDEFCYEKINKDRISKEKLKLGIKGDNDILNIENTIQFLKNNKIEQFEELDFYKNIVNKYNNFINNNTNNKGYLKDIVDFNFDNISQKNKQIIEDKSKINILKLVDNVLFLNQDEKDNLNDFFNSLELLEEDPLNKEINIRGIKYKYNSFLIQSYENLYGKEGSNKEKIKKDFLNLKKGKIQVFIERNNENGFFI